MVEVRRLPGRGVMATLASLREVRLHVIGILCALKILQVATHTVRRRAFVFAADMACVAVQRGVCAGKREARKLQVVECSAEPGVDTVALLAGDGKSGLNVTRASGCLVIVSVAGIALRRQSLELANRRAFVA